MSLADEVLSEHEVIQLMQQHFTVMPNMPIRFGDDVSAVPLSDGEIAVLKTDMLVGQTDVPKGMSLKQAARKAIVMNVSDFASKGVRPSAVIVALGLPKQLATKKAVLEIAEGLNAGVREYDCYVVGGDTNESSDLIIGVSMFGLAQKNTLMLRNGARAGDILAVTGLFGKTSAGLRLILENYKASTKIHDVLIDSVFNPAARLREGLALATSNVGVTASMDSSDGLAWSLHELAKQSNVGFTVNKIPVAAEVEKFASHNEIDATDLALYGGEEYELVLTIKPQLWNEAKTVVNAVGGCLIPIGKATHKKEIILATEGRRRIIEVRGFEHFASRS